MAETDRPLRLGLIGAGRWGRVLIATICRMPEFDLAWLASTAPDAASLVRAGATVTTNWRSFASAGLDGIIIATPAGRHGEPLRAAIAAGLSAFVEKPLVTDVAEAGELAALAAERDATVLVDHTALFHPGYTRLRTMVRRGHPLRIESIGGQWGRRGGDIGALWDYGPHDLALCLDLLGPGALPVSAERISTEPIDGQPCEVIRIRLEAPDGSTATATFGNAMREKQRWLAVDDGTQSLLLDATSEAPLRRAASSAPRHPSDADPRGDQVEVDNALPLDCAFSRFAAAIRGDRSTSPAVTIDLGVAVVEALAWAHARLGA